MIEQSKQEIVRDLIAKDLSNGRRVYQKYFNWALKKLGNWADAEDVVSEFLLSIPSHLENYRYDISVNSDLDSPPLSPWLNGCFHNYFVDFQRRSYRIRKNRVKFNETEDYQNLIVQPEDSLVQKETMSQLGAALASLPEKDRRIITYYHFSEKSYEEIAKLLETNIGTVKSRLHSAREKLSGLIKVIG
jgi:RNA polymerase sigma-70 factor (ECF subfamily)